GRQLHARLRHLLAEEPVGDLDQDAGAVGELRVPADRAAVRQVPQDRQALLDDRVALLPLDVRDEADAAGVVLVRRVVQPLRSGRSGVVHGVTSSGALQKTRIRENSGRTRDYTVDSL